MIGNPSKALLKLPVNDETDLSVIGGSRRDLNSKAISRFYN